MVYAFLIHAIVGDSARIVYERYFSQENLGHICSCKEKTVNLRGIRIPTPNPIQTTPKSSSKDSPFQRRQSPYNKDILDNEKERHSPSGSSAEGHCGGADCEHLPSYRELVVNRRQQSQVVADVVHSEYAFRRAVTGRSAEEDFARLNNDDILPEFELGFIRLLESEPFKSLKIAMWLAAANCAFTLVLEGHENRSVAQDVLKLLIGYLQEHLRILNQPSEAMLKVDRVDLILDRFLPSGQLLFMNHRMTRQLEKQLEQLMKS